MQWHLVGQEAYTHIYKIDLSHLRACHWSVAFQLGFRLPALAEIDHHASESRIPPTSEAPVTTHRSEPSTLVAVRFGKQSTQAVQEQQEEAEEEEDPQQGWSPELRAAEQLVGELIALWGPPIQTLAKAGRAFDGLEFLLGGGRSGTFDLQASSLIL